MGVVEEVTVKVLLVVVLAIFFAVVLALRRGEE